MARPSDIQNPELRVQIEAAFTSMRAGKSSDAVRTLAAAFTRFVELYPAFKAETIELRGRQISKLTRWPNLGANMSPDALRTGAPDIVFARDKFSTSEAMTYYQFVLDEVLAQEAKT